MQWERQQDLPNLLYTNGTEWRLYQDGVHRRTVHFTGDLYDGRVGSPAEFGALLADFLTRSPAPVTSLGGLVTAVARMTRLLRGEVLDQPAAEHTAVRGGADERLQPFLGLAAEWRAMLFPHAGEATFADGYAQTVTFALLLARTEGITVFGESLHTIKEKLRADHSLRGRALQLLTDDVAADFRVTLDLLARTVDAVEWARIRGGGRDTYLHLYEHFLDEYDPDLRKRPGSYYTPVEVVEQMVRLTDDVLVSRLGKQRGFADPGVFTVDPAMGTGTYLHAVLERIAANAAAQDGPGAVSGAVTRAAERVERLSATGLRWEWPRRSRSQERRSWFVRAQKGRASLVVPVLLEPGEMADSMLTSRSCDGSAKLLEALRRHDVFPMSNLSVSNSAPTPRSTPHSPRLSHGLPGTSVVHDGQGAP